MTINEIKDIRIQDFDYPLPDERIAKHPLADRDACKLLAYAGGVISHRTFRDLPDLLPKDTLLVMNNTRVINARMEFFRASGARIEIFLLEPIDPRDYAVAFQTRSHCRWQCMVGNLKKWKDSHLEKSLIIDSKHVMLRATRLDPLPGNSHVVEFEWDDLEVTFASIVEAAGNIPIPPYLNRKSEESDSTDYQTVYSRIKGSVAAPTAGLHFTDALLDELRSKGVETREVTLHVGAGTFQPVKSEDIGSHPMHTEVFEVDRSLVKTLREALETGRQVIAVGTTTVRTLESLPMLGLHLLRGDEQMKVGQWEAYEEGAVGVDTIKCLQALENHMDKLGEDRITASTAIMIAPGFCWQIVKGMVTNFHQPQSTLLLLVSSLLDGGNLNDPAWRHIYQEALDGGYRFLSYGDACLFMNDKLPMPAITINIPGSKSIAARSLVCRLLGGHDTVLANLPDCGDTRGMLRLTECVRNALATGKPTTVDIGEGGTTLRFGMAACASIPGLDIILKGSARLMERPHAVLEDALRNMGASITPVAAENSIRIKGKELCGGVLDLDGSISSQYVSALMLAAPVWRSDTLIRLRGAVVSRPYIEMTAGVMRAFGADVRVQSSDSGDQKMDEGDLLEVLVRATGYPQCARYEIEGDWSGASYFFETLLIKYALGIDSPPIAMPTLKAPAESLQGDSRVAAIFAEATRRLRDKDFSQLTINLNDAPDLVPAIAVGFCIAGLPFCIEGVAHLRHKETDRMTAIFNELARLGYRLITGDDYMAWTGERCGAEKEPIIRTYLDHRMAMAFAPAKLAFPCISIEDPKVVDKSFPDFWNEIGKLTLNDKEPTQLDNKI